LITTDKPRSSNAEDREVSLSMQIFSISAGMVGACLTGIGLLRVLVAQTKTATIGDDLLAADAMLFLACCALSFWCLKSTHEAQRRVLRWMIDALFLIALLVMVVVCGVMTYAIV
jgi:hypothetical protein